MRANKFCRLVVFLLILGVVFPSVGLAQKPTPPPTQQPADPPDNSSGGKQDAPPTPVLPEVKPTPLSTPTQAKEPLPPTLTPAPTDMPTLTPVPRKPTRTPTFTPLPVATATSTPEPELITGLVFNDQDGDGKQGSDEVGIAGVPVVLDGKVVGVTDVSGRFSVSVRGKALLAVVPPQGWQWRGDPVEIQAADQVTTIAIALNQVESKSSVAAGSAVLGVALVGTLVLVFIGFALLTQTAATRSLERTYRQHKNLELERLQVQAVAMRKEELREALGQADGWREVLQQVLADALPTAAIASTDNGWITVLKVSLTPPYFVVARQESGEEYVFTVSPPGRGLLKRNVVIPLDASLAVTARVEVQMVWQYLASKRGFERRVLPRQAEWYLVIQKKKARNNTNIHRRGPSVK